ncbi:MAG: A/G-specific adenine glycosylase [Verrucomicrobiota bacterium]
MPRPRSSPTEQLAERIVTQLLTWFSVNARDLPWRRTHDPYAVWVSEIMLQQTQVKTVIPYWERWMSELPTIESLAAAPSEKIHKLWEGLGYYTRVRNLQKAAQKIVEQRKAEGGKTACPFPKLFDEVLALPGIGRYTAGAICSIAFNQPTPILDGNVIRVLTRLYGISENPRDKEANARLWELAQTLVAGSESQTRISKFPCSHLNQSLMELGALICTPRSPVCQKCPVSQICVAKAKNLQEQLPNLGKRAAATERRVRAFVVRRKGKYLVCQRPAGVVNAHLWEFPNEEISPASSGFNLSDPPFCTVKHSITRYRITLDAFFADETVVKKLIDCDGSWHTLAQLKELSFPSAHKKILAALAELG